MLRRAEKLSGLLRRAASARAYTTPAFPSQKVLHHFSAVQASVLPSWLASLSHGAACRAAAQVGSSSSGSSIVSTFPSVTLTSRRWCSTANAGQQGTTSDPNAQSTHVAPPPAAPPADAEALRDAAAAVAAQLQGLSLEDQKRILAALQQPEQEKSSVMGGGGIGPKDGDMVAAFTCGPCEYRMVKRFSKHAYTKGIVIVECPNCRAKHLLADNLGWLEDEAKNIEDILREKGESFTHIGGTTGDFQFVAEEKDEAAAATPSAAKSRP